MASSSTRSPLTFEEDDLPYEEDILRNPYSVCCWIRYIEHKQKSNASSEAINLLYERALKELPGSYKLWYQYLCLRRKQVAGKCIVDLNKPFKTGIYTRDHAFEEVNNCFRRALVFMHKMPRIWLDYCEFSMLQKRVTPTRLIFNEALRSLPLTQHDRIWPLYLKFVKDFDIPESAIRVYRRYLKLMPENVEEYIDYLLSIDRLDEASLRLASVVNDEKFNSKHGKSHYQLWYELCDLISKNPGKIHSLKVEPIIRQGIRRYTDQVGSLWCALAKYYARTALFERARDIYEEAIQTVNTVCDFSQVYDSYTEFMEQVVRGKMEAAEKCPSDEDNLEIDLYMDRYEDLIFRRPLLVNSVYLRQNPHDVHEWRKRTDLYQNNVLKQIEIYKEAIKTVDPKKQSGKLFELWVDFAKLYESQNMLDDARLIFEKALLVTYTNVSDLASVWCEYAEAELRHNNFDKAIKLMQRATAPPPEKTYFYDESEPVQKRVYKSLKIWSLYADIQESIGDFESCKDVYNRIIDLRIATPQIIFNYGLFLEEHNHFDEAFKVYERGVALFKFPHVHDIWNTYLIKFIKRYGPKKVERVRELFEQCIETCPAEFSKNYFLLYAKFEEEYGLARRAMEVYDRATKKVPKEETFEIYNLYIKRAFELYGVTHTRPIYESALENLPDEKAREIGIRFAEMECKLGEIDRARAIYGYCSQICDPRIHADFWDVWKSFEIKHGNEDTVREMLRIKRSVQATFNTQVNFMSAQMLAAASGQKKTVDEMTAGDSMALLEAKAQQLNDETKVNVKTNNISFVRGTSTEETSRQTHIEEPFLSNPDEIDIDVEDENDEIPQGTQVPSEVFGSLANED